MKGQQTSGISSFYAVLTLVLFSLAILPGCNSGHEPVTDRESFIQADTLYMDDFELLVDTNNNNLVMPISVRVMDSQRFAVLDNGLHSILLFNTSGEELFRFGREGRGPGEWNGARYMDYREGQFILTDVNGLRLLVFDEFGTFTSSPGISVWGRYEQNHMISRERILRAASGFDDVLAIVTTLQEPDSVIQRIGESVLPQPEQMSNLEEAREMLLNREVPAMNINDVMVAGDEQQGYWLFMNALGELRYYDPAGELQWTTVVPTTISESTWEYVIERNSQIASSAYFPIEYAAIMRQQNDQIFILTVPTDPSTKYSQHLLAYSGEGELQRHIVLQWMDGTTTSMGMFDVLPDGSLLMPDFMNGQIFRLTL